MLSEPTRKSALQSHGGGRNHVASRGKALVLIVVFGVSVSRVDCCTGLVSTEPLSKISVHISCL